MAEKLSFYQGEDIEFTIQLNEEYVADKESWVAYVYYDETHSLLSSTDTKYLQMSIEGNNAYIHISHEVTQTAEVMPVGTYVLEILSVANDNGYRRLYQNKKQFELKKSYIVLTGNDIFNAQIAMSKKLNMYNGETIDFILQGDEVFKFGIGGQDFEVFVYPDGIDTSLELNRQYIKIIDSKDTSSNDSQSDGYVVRGEDNTAHCILPYNITKDMKVGPYTVEVRYGDNPKAINMWNTAFTLVQSYSKEV